ncbi:DUF2513 domain-containing protein [Roseofilum sp. BLCC_M154]|uniref:DUF2513 domain-containing protein n=1 Tax=Roseofilum acuticapitatum BLCC-M154 TaxID=3022444 RepID=A0ABT7AQS8_9CYAN|nr:DUF2513 domain-containing protein [Roseofilum acuticapitatum]MDJ1168907.1 DUF2513 domain-containing protein [Roseofilum acuticapitatum BLCC-M154]
MKRDPNLIYQILLQIESMENTEENQNLSLEDASTDIIEQHLMMMYEEELITGDLTPHTMNSKPRCIPTGLTRKRYNLLDSIRSEVDSRENERVNTNKMGFVQD